MPEPHLACRTSHAFNNASGVVEATSLDLDQLGAAHDLLGSGLHSQEQPSSFVT